MIVTLWHNPKCSTSRRVLADLQAAGHEVQVVEYLKTPPDRAALAAMLATLKARPADILRRRGNDDLLAAEPAGGFDDAALLDLMAQHPILIERPIARSPKGAVLCRPAERLAEIL
ncbi:ArsC/Spx/MgsR family protein [Nitrospirillum pindoramense]|uniref:Arsenate reductase n=1 Tax=Nitrospirillum amazonense TaxID=28077 RepID=A0A560GW15_9PROT|nr:ArsC/Spx/MgsR family protein [Nitrospirillum amazonense]TWB38198.1 arsenate reductase [Nitrospirillum amazonense]